MEEQKIAPADNYNHDRQLTAVAIGDDATHVLDRSLESAQPDATDPPVRRSPESPAAKVTTGDNNNQARHPTVDQAANVRPPEQERSAADDGAANISARRLATMEEDASNADDDSRADASAKDSEEGDVQEEAGLSMLASVFALG